MSNRKALLQGMIDELWNPRPSSSFERYYTDDFLNHDPAAPEATTREELQQAALDLPVGFPDYISNRDEPHSRRITVDTRRRS